MVDLSLKLSLDKESFSHLKLKFYTVDISHYNDHGTEVLGTVKSPIMDTPIRGQPPYNGQTVCPLPLTVHTFLPPTKGQPPNNGQNARPHNIYIYIYTLYLRRRDNLRTMDKMLVPTIYYYIPFLCVASGNSMYRTDVHTLN